MLAKPGVFISLKWLIFLVLEWLSEIRLFLISAEAPAGLDRGRAAAGHSAQDPSPALWVFVSTIGELNAIDPLLKGLIKELGSPPLVLLTDHEHYRDAYLAKYKTAKVWVLTSRSSQIKELLLASSPSMLILGEIPSLLSDAPCRFPFAMIYELKKRGVPICVVNGWLYRGHPSCRIDRIERFLFQRDYVRLIDLYLVQNDAIKNELIHKGAAPEKVKVTGNIKFDATDQSGWLLSRTRSPELLQAMQQSGRPIIVAGCITKLDEKALLSAYAKVKSKFPHALLVIALRHPESIERMQGLENTLRQIDFLFGFKSRMPLKVLADIDILVLDTMGELKDFYAVSTICYVGKDHNVLEPLSFFKPVIVSAGWQSIHPSYAVYELARDKSLIHEVADVESLGDEFILALSHQGRYAESLENINKVLAAEKGATERNLAALHFLIDQGSVR